LRIYRATVGVHGKNGFAERSKILYYMDIDQKSNLVELSK